MLSFFSDPEPDAEYTSQSNAAPMIEPAPAAQIESSVQTSRRSPRKKATSLAEHISDPEPSAQSTAQYNAAPIIEPASAVQTEPNVAHVPLVEPAKKDQGSYIP